MRYRFIVVGDLHPAVEVVLAASVAWRATSGCPLGGADSFRGCQDAVKISVRIESESVVFDGFALLCDFASDLCKWYKMVTRG